MSCKTCLKITTISKFLNLYVDIIPDIVIKPKPVTYNWTVEDIDNRYKISVIQSKRVQDIVDRIP